MNSNPNLRPLFLFSVVVILSSWLGYGLEILVETPANEPGPGMLLWLLLPLLTVIFVRTFMGEGWQDAGLHPDFKRNAIYYVFSLLIYPTVATLILALGGIMGVVTAPHFSFSSLLGAFLVGLMPAFIKNIFEEFAWRGYLVPKIHVLGLNIYVEYLIVGLIWWSWHLAYLLFMLDRAILQAATTQSMPSLLFMTGVNLVAATIVYNELRLLSNSVWPPLVLHAIGNALVDILVVQGFFQIAPGWDIVFSPGHQSILTGLCFACLGFMLQRHRLKG